MKNESLNSLANACHVAGRYHPCRGEVQLLHLLDRIGHWLVRQHDAMRQEARYQRAAEELAALDDRLLKDIGISRSDIRYVARHGRPADIRRGRPGDD